MEASVSPLRSLSVNRVLLHEGPEAHPRPSLVLRICLQTSTVTCVSPLPCKRQHLIPSTIAVSSQTLTSSTCFAAHSTTISWQARTCPAPGHSSLCSHRSASASFRPAAPVPWTGLFRQSFSLCTSVRRLPL